MYSSIRTYNKTNNPFFSFTGKKISPEKSCAAHYDYDVHGNVKTLIQDNAQINVSGQRYKKIEYEYDLISGKVNAVHYQNNQPDQFHHKYEYDADNRITDVYTSKDKILWDHDAKYFYYPHGPLARIEYGDNHVQGMDYAYTLQGWIKGVNSETLENTRDMGNDGNPATGNPNAYFAKDAFGYSLTYFENDYQSIGTKSFEADKQNSDLLKARNDLFNGNISAMVTTITNPLTGQALPQGTAYKYDQLNRLIESKAFANIDAASNAWSIGLTYNGMYHNKFTYDANGNIETAYVKNNLGEIIDDQTYQYNLVNGKKTNNRLLAVTDAATQTDGYDLPSTQQTANYGYTELGELNYDVQDSIAEIKRRVDGKITEVIRTAGSTKKNLKFDYDATGNRIAKHVYTNDGTWVKSEFYVRDAQGNILSTYQHAVDASTQTASYKQTERHLYGSSLLGMDQTQTELIGTPPVSLTSFTRTLGLKSYTGANHLGNDLVIFTDKKQGVDGDNDGIVDYYVADVVSSKDYGPFGEYLTGRVFAANKYPNSFNGKRDDEELFGWQDYGFRNYMKARRTFDRPDPLIVYQQKYPELSTYQFAGLNPIRYIDLDGLEPLEHGATRIYASTKLTTGKIGIKGSVFKIPFSMLFSSDALDLELRTYVDVYPTRGKLDFGISFIRRETTSGFQGKLGHLEGGKNEIREQTDYISTANGYKSIKETTFKTEENAGIENYSNDGGTNKLSVGGEGGIGVAGGGAEIGMQEQKVVKSVKINKADSKKNNNAPSEVLVGGSNDAVIKLD